MAAQELERQKERLEAAQEAGDEAAVAAAAEKVAEAAENLEKEAAEAGLAAYLVEIKDIRKKDRIAHHDRTLKRNMASGSKLAFRAAFTALVLLAVCFFGISQATTEHQVSFTLHGTLCCHVLDSSGLRTFLKCVICVQSAARSLLLTLCRRPCVAYPVWQGRMNSGSISEFEAALGNGTPQPHSLSLTSCLVSCVPSHG